jgi:hypothetical protein
LSLTFGVRKEKRRRIKINKERKKKLKMRKTIS